MAQWVLSCQVRVQAQAQEEVVAELAREQAEVPVQVGVVEEAGLRSQ